MNMIGFKYVITSVVWNLIDDLFYTAPERSGAYRLKHQGILKLILDTFRYVLAILRQTVMAVQISPLLKDRYGPVLFLLCEPPHCWYSYSTICWVSLCFLFASQMASHK